MLEDHHVNKRFENNEITKTSFLQNELEPAGSQIFSSKIENSHSNNLQTEGKQMDNPEFCMNMSGMNMVMYMRGFHRSTAQQQGERPLPCLVYYYNTWVLKERGQFTGAMVYSFLLALLTQSLSGLRAVVVRHTRNRRTRRIFLSIIYPLQQALGYLIMLGTMMYSVELLFAVVIGVALGNRLFVKGEQPALARSRANLPPPAGGGSSGVQGNSNSQTTTRQEGREEDPTII